MDVEPTAQIIDDMADRMRKYAEDLTKIAASMREKKDLNYAAEATNTVCNCIQNLRLDLLVTRPIREMERQKHMKALP